MSNEHDKERAQAVLAGLGSAITALLVQAAEEASDRKRFVELINNLANPAELSNTPDVLAAHQVSFTAALDRINAIDEKGSIEKLSNGVGLAFTAVGMILATIHPDRKSEMQRVALGLMAATKREDPTLEDHSPSLLPLESLQVGLR